MLFCDYSQSDVCPVCRRTGIQGYVRGCIGPPDPNNPRPNAKRVCVHRGAATGEKALVRCNTCQGNVRKKQPLYACAVFGQCVTVPTVEGEAKSCVGCERFEAP